MRYYADETFEAELPADLRALTRARGPGMRVLGPEIGRAQADATAATLAARLRMLLLWALALFGSLAVAAWLAALAWMVRVIRRAEELGGLERWT